METRTRRLPAYIAIAMGMTAGIGGAQSLTDQVNFRSVSLGGFRLYGISAYTGYATSPLALGLGQATPTGAQQLEGSGSYGAGASFGWQHHRERTNLSLLYGLSYGGVVRYSDLNGLSNSLSLTASRQLTPRWTFTVTASAQDSTQAEYLYQPSPLSVISQVPASFDDLAAAFSVGRFRDAQTAATLTGARLTGASILDTEVRGLVLGNRVLSYSGTVGLNYAPTSRLSFHISTFSAGGQIRRGGQNDLPETTYAQPRSIGMNAGMGVSYSLSPRTQVGFSVQQARMINRYQNASITDTSFSFGRRMGMRWFLSMHAGGSFTRTIQSTYGTPTSMQVIGGGSMGFHTYTQTFMASYERSSSDAYGLAVGTSTFATGSWNWRRPGSRWTIFASGGQNQIRDTGFASLSGWETSGGISGRLDLHTSISAQYVYFNSRGRYVGNFSNVVFHSVRLSLGWNPQTVPTPVKR